MKTRLLFASILLLTFSACIKDYHGGGPEEIEFTGKNYIYEGDLYRIYLKTEIETLDIRIQELENIIADKQGDDKTKVELQEAMEQRVFFNNEFQNILDTGQVGRNIPRPPGPCPRPSNCDFSDLQYLLTGKGISQIQILFLNESGKVIGGGEIDELSPLPDTGDQLNFSRIAIAGNGDKVASIEIAVTGVEGKRTYSVQ